MRYGMNRVTNEFEIYLSEEEAQEMKAALKSSGLIHRRKFHKLIEQL
jgi:hypothetical protein